MKLWISTLRYRYRLFQAKNNIMDFSAEWEHFFKAKEDRDNVINKFPAKWKKYLKAKEGQDNVNLEDDIDFIDDIESSVELAKSNIEFSMSLALLALSKFDKLDIYNNNRVSDFNKKKLLAEANELRQQVNQMKAKLEAE